MITKLIPKILFCPKCNTQHIDEKEWTTRLHKTHQCQSCFHEWRPFNFATVGVKSLSLWQRFVNYWLYEPAPLPVGHNPSPPTGNRPAPPPAPPMRLICEGVSIGSSPTPIKFDLIAHLIRQRTFSSKTFGPGRRTKGVIKHIKKELIEIEKDPTDLEEWIDVILLACDGARRAGYSETNPNGYSPEQITSMLSYKLTKNEQRDWPDWRDVPTDAAIEHKE